MEDIASVSLARPLGDIADELGESFEQWGFGVVRDHGIPDELVAHAWELTREFFALPEEVKRGYHVPARVAVAQVSLHLDALGFREVAQRAGDETLVAGMRFHHSLLSSRARGDGRS